jgi:PAS domain S-box-containing protein
MDARKILIVEDEILNARMLEHALLGHGYEVVGRVASGKDAIEKAEMLKPDMILMDIGLEGEIDGIAAAGIIRERHSIPVIFVTAATDRELLDRVKAVEPYGYIIKPFDRERLQIILDLAFARLSAEIKRNAVQKALEWEKKSWEDTFNAVPDLITILDRERRIQRVNRAMAERLGCNPRECEGKVCYEVVHGSEEAPEHCPHVMLIDDGREHTLELHEEHLGGDFIVTASPIYGKEGDLIGSVHVCRDVSLLKKTERALQKAYEGLERRVEKRTVELSLANRALKKEIEKRLRIEKSLRAQEMELKESQKALRRLAGSLIATQEEERRLVARELHDDLTQRLAVLAIDARSIEQHADTLNDHERARLSHMREELVKLSEDIHGISRHLHPSIIDDLGLVRAVHSECANFTQREGIKIRLKTGDVPRGIPRPQSLCIYRVLQESLKNLAKYASVEEADVELHGTEKDITLTVRDYGRGFEPTDPRMKKAGIGFNSIKERALLVKGDLSIESSPGCGTSVRLKVPLKRK